MTRTVVYFTDSTAFGGAEQSLLNLLGGLDRRAWRPVLSFHAGAGVEPLWLGARSLDIAAVPVPPLPADRRGAARIPSFVRQLAALRPDVFHAHLTWPLACKWALLGAAVARVPAIVTTLHLFVELPYTRRIRLEQRLLRTRIHRHIAVSRAVAARWRAVFGVSDHKIRVVHNGIPLESFSPAAGRTVHVPGVDASSAPVVLNVARLDVQKGQGYLLQAAARVPGAVFLLVGDGPDRATLEAQARELRLGNRAVFLGHRRDIPDLLARCDLFVLPSLWEGLPLSILEAMAAGKPVIATSVGGTPEAITQGETGLLVPPADPGALAAAIQAVLADPGLAARLAAAGRARVYREFSVDTMVRGVTAIYDELLDGAETAAEREPPA